MSQNRDRSAFAGQNMEQVCCWILTIHWETGCSSLNRNQANNAMKPETFPVLHVSDMFYSFLCVVRLGMADVTNVQPRPSLSCVRRTATGPSETETSLMIELLVQSLSRVNEVCTYAKNRRASRLQASQCVIMNTFMFKEKQSYYQAEKDSRFHQSKRAVI